jgi:hypothetical protein
MPEGFPKPPGITGEEQFKLDTVYEEIHGPVIGAFVIERVSNGDHPEEVKEAWSGTRLPVRKYPNLGMKYGAEHIYVDAGEAYNALIINEAPDSVLRYWMDTLPSSPEALLGFLMADGTYEHFHAEDTHSPEDIPF